MDNRYKIILSNRNIYKEIELSPEMQCVRIGTSIESDVRLRKELFFEEFEMIFSKNRNWSIVCSDNLYISLGDSKKLLAKDLSHGDLFAIKYQDSNNELLNIEFLIDFENEERQYDVAIDVSGLVHITIGGESNSNIVIEDEYIGQDTLTIANNSGVYSIINYNTKYGIRVNGNKVEENKRLSDNDFISFASISLCLKDNWLYIDSSRIRRLNNVNSKSVKESKNELVYPKFNRNTRIKSKIPNDKIDILDPPTAPQKPSGNIVMQLLPALVMLAVTIVLRGIMSSSGGSYVWISVISMSIGIITSTVSIISERRKYKKDTKERIEKYSEYINQKRKFIEQCRKNEEELLKSTYYSLQDELQMVEDFSDCLFDRDLDDDDYLDIRIGYGNKKAVKEINYKKKEQLECTDELMRKPEELFDEYINVNNVPITLNLRNNSSVGIIGNRTDLYEFLKVITVDLAVRQYYTDTKMFFVLEEQDKDAFMWVRMLPHIKNEALNMRNIVCDLDSRNVLFEFLYKELSFREIEKKTFPNYVVFVYRDNGIKRHPISRFIDIATSVGVSFVFFEEYKELLPQGCDKLIYLNGSEGNVVNSENRNENIDFKFDTISNGGLDKLVKKLSPIYCEEVSLEGSLTKNISLFELLNILNVEDIDLEKNWQDSQVYKTMQAPLGVKSKNEIVYLDLNEKKHGPHGLVAGTTGSGKSEILQTYILSMATLFHPYDVGFVIIDFKGGGMVNQFKNLPHLIGAITNIDGREINRSLSSIKAELRKRQELFAKYNVNHIDAYIKLFKKGQTDIPLPHLILIVDEFAELKMDQPEFMKELISAARIGRSLGVHLILATQKPSGVVDAQIWSNSKFKLCLKVQNKDDSNEVLKTPVAAEIKEPGRAYLQVGNNEIFELFQSAYSGASASFDESAQQKSFTIYSLDLAGKHTPVYTKSVEKKGDEQESQLEAITNYVAAYCKKTGIDKLPGICLPPLEELILFETKTVAYDGVNTVVNLGIFDDPDNQYQGIASLDISTGNTVIIGSSQYGKTNLLQLIIRSITSSYRPSEVNLYILDFASMALNVFSDINHIGGIVSAAEDEKLKNFMRLIQREMKMRKERFASLGITSFSSYKEAGNNDIPQIVIMIDNFLALKELYPEYEDDIVNICREGVAIGISLIITSIQTNGISYKYMSNFAHRICMYCNQGDEYGSVFDKCRMTPKNVPGRCLYEINKTVFEMQTFLAFEGKKEIDRVQKIKEYSQLVNSKYMEEYATRIPEVPKVLNQKYISDYYKSKEPYVLPVGVNYDTVDFVVANLCNITTMAVTGKRQYGKTSFVKYIMEYLQKNIFNFESSVYIVDSYEQQLKSLNSMGIVEKYTVDLNDFELCLSDVEQIMQNRLSNVKEEGIGCLTDEPLIVFVIQNRDVFASDGLSKTALESYKRLIKTYKDMKLLFVFADVDNMPIAYGASEMLKSMKDVGVLVAMEDIANLKLVDINANTARQFKKPIELGDAYWITEGGIEKMKVVHQED